MEDDGAEYVGGCAAVDLDVRFGEAVAYVDCEECAFGGVED